MKKSKILISVLLSCILLISCRNTESLLQKKLLELTNEFPGEVGVAMIYGDDTICINGAEHFPMFSVVKFHQALAVSEKLRHGKQTDINVTAKDLKTDTWSPMREKYPDGGIFSVNQLLEYTLIESDNNACDILFKNIASPILVDSIIHNWGIKDFRIAWTENKQHADINRCYDNWTSPLAATLLLGKFYETRNTDEYSRFIWNTMANCQTGANRIPKYISSDVATIVHKTGTGGITPDGKVMGINDIACIILPDGRHFELAVFIKNADCTPAECEELIAEIAKICFEKIKNSKQ